MDVTRRTLDGYLADHPLPGPRGTARFRLSSASTARGPRGTITTCTTSTAHLVEQVLRELRVGDYLCVTGVPAPPEQAGEHDVDLVVDALEVLAEAAPTLAELAEIAAAHQRLTYTRYTRRDRYAVIATTDSTTVHVWAEETGTMIGIVQGTGAFEDWIAAWETAHGAG